MPGVASVAAQAESENQYPAAAHRQNRRGLGIGAIVAYSSGSDTSTVQRLQRLPQARLTPVQYMVVGEAAAIHLSCGDHAGVQRVHPVIDTLFFPVS